MVQCLSGQNTNQPRPLCTNEGTARLNPSLYRWRIWGPGCVSKMLKPSNRRIWLECRFYCLPEKNKYIIKDVFLLFPLRKGANSCEYIEKLWIFAGKRCSSNATHVPKVKENGLLKEKIVVTKRQKCLGVSDQITFLQKKANTSLWPFPNRILLNILLSGFTKVYCRNLNINKYHSGSF